MHYTNPPQYLGTPQRLPAVRNTKSASDFDVATPDTSAPKRLMLAFLAGAPILLIGLILADIVREADKIGKSQR